MKELIIDGQKAEVLKALGYDNCGNVMMLVRIDNCEIPVIIHNNGYSIPKDWQGFLPTTPEEIGEIDWIDVCSYR